MSGNAPEHQEIPGHCWDVWLETFWMETTDLLKGSIVKMKQYGLKHAITSVLVLCLYSLLLSLVLVNIVSTSHRVILVPG